MGFSTTIAILRTVIYLWVGIEFANLAYLYLYGYEKIKPSPIISALQVMCASLSVVFLALAFLPILLEVDTDFHKSVVSFLPVLLVPLGFAVRKFRKESLVKQVMKLPSDPKKTN